MDEEDRDDRCAHRDRAVGGRGSQRVHPVPRRGTGWCGGVCLGVVGLRRYWAGWPLRLYGARMLRSMLLAAGRSPRMRALAEGSAPLRPLVNRFVAGTDLDAALPVIAGLATDRLVTVDHLGENTPDRAGA